MEKLGLAACFIFQDKYYIEYNNSFMKWKLIREGSKSMTMFGRFSSQITIPLFAMLLYRTIFNKQFRDPLSQT